MERNRSVNTKLTAKAKQGKRIYQFVLLVDTLLLLTFINYLTDADRSLAQFIYGVDGRWPGIGTFPWDMLYTWAPAPGFFIAGCAILLLGMGYFFPGPRKCWRQAVFLILLLAIGPGLIVNVLLKDQLGRARPREIIECGGKYPYTEIWEKGSAGTNSSFPSGHSSIAFYSLAPWFIFRDNKRRLARRFLLFGVIFGSAVGLARMLQGGHFLNDVLWAGGIVYMTGEILAMFLLPPDPVGEAGERREINPECVPG